MINKEDLKDIKFEAALDKLEDIISRLQEGHLTLDESLESFQEGINLIKICQDKLDSTETKVSLLIKNCDGTTSEVPFEFESER